MHKFEREWEDWFVIQLHEYLPGAQKERIPEEAMTDILERACTEWNMVLLTTLLLDEEWLGDYSSACEALKFLRETGQHLMDSTGSERLPPSLTSASAQHEWTGRWDEVCDALTAVAEVLAAKVPGERACALAEQCRQDAKRFKSTRSLPSDEIHNPPPPGHHFIVPPGAPAPQSSGYLLQDSPPGGFCHAAMLSKLSLGGDKAFAGAPRENSPGSSSPSTSTEFEFYARAGSKSTGSPPHGDRGAWDAAIQQLHEVLPPELHSAAPQLLQEAKSARTIPHLPAPFWSFCSATNHLGLSGVTSKRPSTHTLTSRNCCCSGSSSGSSSSSDSNNSPTKCL